MARGGTRRGPSSLEHASPSAKKRVLFLAPFFHFFSSPFSPIRPHPHMGGAPTTGGGFDARAVYGGPCTARAMSVAPRHGRPWQARLGEGGKGPATECLAFTIHSSPKTLVDPHMCPSRRPFGPWPYPCLGALKGRPRSHGSGVSRHGDGYGYGFPGLADGPHRPTSRTIQ